MGPGLPISVVASQLGVDPATLRAWQRRYGLGASVRSPGGHRRYTQQDVRRLTDMRELMAAGVTAAEAARVVRAQADGDLLARADGDVLARADGDRLPPSSPSLAERDAAVPFSLEPGHLRQAALALDGREVATLLRRSLATHGSCLTWEMLVRPAMRAVDSGPMSRAYRIAAEHLLSYFVSTIFVAHASRFSLAGPPPGHGPALLACAPAEQHSLPLTALAATLAESRIDVDVLGARTPTPALAAAVATTDPSAVLVLALHSPTAELSVFDQPRRRLTWIAAGPGWAAAELPAGVTFVDGLDPAARLIEAAHTDPARRH